MRRSDYTLRHDMSEIVVLGNGHKSLPQRLAAMMAMKGYSRRDVAELICVSEATVYFWLTGRSLPGCRAIICLCKLFGCSADYLLCLEESFDRREEGGC